MAWPRSPDAPWYVNYGMALSTGIVVGTGLIYMIMYSPYKRGNAPAGDAWTLADNASQEDIAQPETAV